MYHYKLNHDVAKKPWSSVVLIFWWKLSDCLNRVRDYSRNLQRKNINDDALISHFLFHHIKA